MFFIKITKRLVNMLPLTSWGFRYYQLINFVYAHRRLPRRNSGLFNDYLYYKTLSQHLLTPLVQLSTDKILSKWFFAANNGEKYVVKTLAEFSSIGSLRNYVAQKDSVIKPAHDSQLVLYVDTDSRLTESQLNAAAPYFKSNRYKLYREKNYACLEPRFLAEELLDSEKSIVDYKIFCWKGSPKLIQEDSDRVDRHRQNFYDLNWNKLNICYIAPNRKPSKKPHTLSEMLEVARSLSKFFEFCRVDLYEVDGVVKIGEVTHVPNRGFGKFDSIDDEKRFSEILFR